MSRFLLLFTLLLTSWTVSAEGIPTPTPTPSAPSHPFVIPEPPKIAAKAYLLIDYNSGYVLAEKDAHKRIEPASLTKIMTGSVVINELKNGSIKLTDEVTISPKAWKMPGSKMFIEVGKNVSV
jgi:D-alanyl-D-alanine carboxypeptidase (penicillin-binding protein 5/6)